MSPTVEELKPLRAEELNPLREGVQLRAALEIQRAHDMLKGIAIGEIPIAFGGPDAELQRAMMFSALDVLCWVLRHDHNTEFATNLDALEEAAAKAGFALSTCETTKESPEAG